MLETKKINQPGRTFIAELVRSNK